MFPQPQLLTVCLLRGLHHQRNLTDHTIEWDNKAAQPHQQQASAHLEKIESSEHHGFLHRFDIAVCQVKHSTLSHNENGEVRSMTEHPVSIALS
jgi:hypothetical protein